MEIKINQPSRALLLSIKQRKRGNMEKDGQIISWDDAVQLVTIPFEDSKGQARKYSIAPDCVNDILQQLKPLHWGAVVELKFKDNLVIDVQLVDDVMSSFFMNEEIEL